MKGDYTVNKKVAPKDWTGFSKWHPLACPSDPLTSEERYKQLGYKLPKKKSEDSGTKEAE